MRCTVFLKIWDTFHFGQKLIARKRREICGFEWNF